MHLKTRGPRVDGSVVRSGVNGTVFTRSGLLLSRTGREGHHSDSSPTVIEESLSDV